MSKNRKPDPLSVQVSFRVSLPPGKAVSKALLNKVYLNWIETGELPQAVKIRGIFWKNSARRGKLSDWRYSEGSDLSVLIPGYKQLKDKPGAREARGVEDAPRGDHEEARETLQGALREIRPF